MNVTRIDMAGHGYGGYMTSFAMTPSKLFAAGIAGLPVTDSRDYDSIYTKVHGPAQTTHKVRHQFRRQGRQKSSWQAI